MKRTILIYGGSLALLAFLLQYIEYKYAIHSLSTEVYVIFIALLFTGLGLWVGRKLTNPQSKQEVEFVVNQKALQYLKISEREYEVLELLSHGHSNKEIADKLFVSTNTIKTHLSHLYEKLEVSRRAQAIQKAKELTLIP